jgi:hypothetical protein
MKGQLSKWKWKCQMLEERGEAARQRFDWQRYSASKKGGEGAHSIRASRDVERASSSFWGLGEV